MRALRSFTLPIFLTLLLGVPWSAGAQDVPSPEEYFGFEMGTAKMLARWDSIVAYFEVVAGGSDRILVDTLGESTLGNPFIVVTLSSPTNLDRLTAIRTASAALAQGRVSRGEAEVLARDLPATVVINHNIHSTEIGASQTSVDLVYRLAGATDPETLEILDNVVTVLIPSSNPDGQIMVTDWYRTNLGTDFEEARMPYLYHAYAGHDNNRDFFQGNLVETRYWMDVMFRVAYPQLYLDQHQMGSTGPRMFVPPYPGPMDPDIHPLQWQSLQFMGGGIVADLQRAGKQGVITGQMYRIWGQEGALTGRHHNIVALLTETASANIASPRTVTRGELELGARRLGPGAQYGFNVNFVDPWWGGEWTLADIVSYQTVAAVSFLKQAARFHDDYLMGRWQMASETIERAREEGPYAWVIPMDQADPVAAADMARRLALQGIEVHQARRDFEATPSNRSPRPQNRDPDRLAEWAGTAHTGMTDREETTAEPEDIEGEAESEEASASETMHESEEHAAMREMHHPSPRTFNAGSWIVLAAQPSWAALEDLMMPQDRDLLYEHPDGPFLRSYDGAGYTMPLQMGVESILVDAAFEVDLQEPSFAPATSPLPAADQWYALSTSVTQAYRVANHLMAEGVPVSRSSGYLLVSAHDPRATTELSRLARETGVPVMADPEDLGIAEPLARARVGLYQGWAASMDEGWTRLLLEEYGFDLTVLGNDDVRSGELDRELDVVIIPSEISLDRLIDGLSDEDAPEGFRGGIGEEGVEKLKAFVRAGGTLVTLGTGDRVVLEHFDVPVRDALADMPASEVFTPASLYRMELDPAHRLAEGSPQELAAKWAGGRAYEPTGWDGEAGIIRTVGRWATDPDRLLMSGLVVGAEHLSGKANLLDVEYGAGHVYMYGFRVQHRAQTLGTFKLLFNALMRANDRSATDG